MRTLNENYKPDKYGNQLIPCCGNFFIADPDDDSCVIITGYPNGIDWTIEHIENNQIKHIAKSGEEGIIGKEEYRKIITDFASQIETFYNESQPKKLPKDEFDRKGYEAFWKEWEYLKEKLKNKN
ncbi:MAG: hypothetical protein ACJAWV_000508 [Flammeovirgaceae bacterium]|jgi:hypothetical protein